MIMSESLSERRSFLVCVCVCVCFPILVKRNQVENVEEAEIWIETEQNESGNLKPSLVLTCCCCCCCCCCVTSVVSNSVLPHRRQPTRLCCPWDSPGKNTGVGCHFLLQCRKVKTESEVAQKCPTLSDPMVCSLPGSSVHGIFQARVLEWGCLQCYIPNPHEVLTRRTRAQSRSPLKP